MGKVKKPELTIECYRTKNGGTIRVIDSDLKETSEFSFQESDDSDYDTLERLAAILYEVANSFSPCGTNSKYSDNRIYITILPGRDNENFDKKAREFVGSN